MTVNFSDLVFTVAYSAEDDEWVASVSAFPSLSWIDPSASGALDGLIEVLEADGLLED